MPHAAFRPIRLSHLCADIRIGGAGKATPQEGEQKQKSYPSHETLPPGLPLSPFIRGSAFLFLPEAHQMPSTVS